MQPQPKLRNKPSRKIQKLKIIINANGDSYIGYVENVDDVYGEGKSVEEAKQSILKQLELIKRCNEIENIPDILQNHYELVFKFDIKSFLNLYHKIISNAAIERMTGINQKQISHYLKGIKKPRKAQVKRIKLAMHCLAQELMAIEL